MHRRHTNAQWNHLNTQVYIRDSTWRHRVQKKTKTKTSNNVYSKRESLYLGISQCHSIESNNLIYNNEYGSQGLLVAPNQKHHLTVYHYLWHLCGLRVYCNLP